jgi:epoxyqueuosine reductase QueG
MKLYQLMRKPPRFMRASKRITKDDNPVESGPNARKAVMIPLVIAQYGSTKQKFESAGDSLPRMKNAIKNLLVSAKDLRNNPRPGKKSMEAETRQEMEAFIRSLGVSSIGYTRVNPDHIFEGFEILHENAIVITMEMDRELVKTSPSKEFANEIYRTYDELGIAVNKIADWLRERGYSCHASPAVGGDVNTVPVAQAAGLGCVGKNGILVTPEYGPCVRLAAIFVEIENLPLYNASEHLWIRDFCETCNRCIKTCPAEAIYQEPEILADGTERFIDLERCAVPFSEGCSTCIKDCVFTPGNYEKIKKSFMTKSSIH